MESSCKIKNPHFKIPDFFKHLQFTDIKETWTNDDRTLVFRLPLGIHELGIDMYLDFIEFVGNSGCSELLTMDFEGEIFCKMYAKWWAEY